MKEFFPFETEMNFNDETHNKRFNAEAEKFSLETFDDRVERHVKGKSGIFDNGVITVPENTSAVIALAQKEIRAALKKATERLQAGEDDRRGQQRDSLFKKFLPVLPRTGIPRAWEPNEEG